MKILSFVHTYTYLLVFYQILHFYREFHTSLEYDLNLGNRAFKPVDFRKPIRTINDQSITSQA